MIIDSWLIVIITAIGTFVLEWPVKYILERNRIFDKPNKRSSHSTQTVRGGGIGILTIVIISSTFLYVKSIINIQLLWLIALSTILGIVSFVDDVKSLSVVFRFICQSAGSLAVLILLVWPNASTFISKSISDLMTLTISLILINFWILGYTNTFNFMDGVNGIAGSQAVLGFGGLALLVGMETGQWKAPIVQLSLVITGAVAGFLPHNFPKARMFMGDVGSIPLGFLSAVMVVWAGNEFGWWLLVPLTLLHANFFLDTGITLGRRIFGSEKWYHAHRDHFYQRLQRSGKSHTFVTLTEIILQCLVFGLMVVYIYGNSVHRVVIGVSVIIIWLCYFYYCEVSYRNANKNVNNS